MDLNFDLKVRVSAPTKTTTKVDMEMLGVKVERSAGSVQRAVIEALTEFALLIRTALVLAAREARTKDPWVPRVIDVKDSVPEKEPEAPEPPAGPLPEAGPLFTGLTTGTAGAPLVAGGSTQSVGFIDDPITPHVGP